MNRGREILGAVLLVTASTLIAVVGAEVFIRLRSKVPRARDLFPPSLSRTIDSMSHRAASCSFKDRLYPHPYLDFVQHRPAHCESAPVNSSGFHGPDFPSENQAKSYDVLVLGGSVADHLLTSMGERSLIAELEKFQTRDGRRLKVYAAAVESWKEPQLFFTYFMYQHLFDAVVTIGGYNEMRTLVNQRNSLYVPLYSSIAFHRYPDFSSHWLLDFGGWLHGAWSRSVLLSNSYLATSLVKAVLVWIERTLLAELEKLKVFGYVPRSSGKFQDVLTYFTILEKYQLVAESNGQRFAHFFQPVLGVGKTVSAEEKSFLDEPNFYASYQRMVEDSVRLKVPVHSLTGVLKDVRETVYADDVHMRLSPDGSSPGYEIVIQNIVKELALEWKLVRI